MSHIAYTFTLGGQPLSKQLYKSVTMRSVRFYAIYCHMSFAFFTLCMTLEGYDVLCTSCMLLFKYSLALYKISTYYIEYCLILISSKDYKEKFG